MLNCIRLERERTPREENILSASKKYGLVPLESVQGVIQSEERDWRSSTKELCENQNRSKRMWFDEDTNWRRKQFFLSRFHSSSHDEYHEHEVTASS